jgi:hypothetical protein
MRSFGQSHHFLDAQVTAQEGGPVVVTSETLAFASAIGHEKRKHRTDHRDRTYTSLNAGTVTSTSPHLSSSTQLSSREPTSQVAANDIQ